MKIRIKGNRIRLRLAKSDVQHLKENGVVEEVTVIAPGKYSDMRLAAVNKLMKLNPIFLIMKIRIILPLNDAKTLTETDIIGVESYQDNGEDEQLFLLIEKDLKCLEHAREDQGDMYDNPNKNC